MTRTSARPGAALPALERGQISTNQFVWMLVGIITSYSIAFVPGILLQVTQPDGLISILLAWGSDVALALVYAYMGLRFPRQTFVQYASTVLGPWLGKPVGLMFPLFFWFVSALLLRWSSEMLVDLFLPGTPTLVVLATTLLVVAYGARAGLETVARAAEVMAPLFILIIGVLLLLVAPQMRFEFVPPMLEDGWGPPLRGVPLVLSFLAICIMMGMFQAYQNEPHRAWFAKLSAVSIGSLVLAGIVLASIALLGPEAASASMYPDLAVVRVVAIGEFVERIDMLWMATALGAAVLSLSILLWATALGVSQTFGLKDYRPLVFPLAGLTLPVALILFEGQIEEVIFTETYFPIYALSVEAGLVILLWLVALARGIRGPGQSPGRVSEPETPAP